MGVEGMAEAMHTTLVQVTRVDDYHEAVEMIRRVLASHNISEYAIDTLISEFGINALARTPDRIVRKTNIRRPVASKVFVLGNRVFEYMINVVDDELTPYELGVVGLVHDTHFKHGSHYTMVDTLKYFSNRDEKMFKMAVWLSMAPSYVGLVDDIDKIKGRTFLMIFRRAKKLAELGIL